MNQARWSKAKLLVRARDGDKCLKCLGLADEVHHRIVRGMGGSGDDEINYGLANLVSVCRQCHQEIHENPSESYETGFLLHSWKNPADAWLVVKPGSFLVKLSSSGEIEVIGNHAFF